MNKIGGTIVTIDIGTSKVSLIVSKVNKFNKLEIVHIETKNYRVRLFRKVKIIVGKPIPYEELGFEKGNMAEYNAASRLIFERICELGKEEQK